VSSSLTARTIGPQSPVPVGAAFAVASWGWSGRAGGMALTARSSHEPTFEANVRFDKL
jgi:hypothetical protein